MATTRPPTVSPQSPDASPNLQRLEVFVGQWHTEGSSYAEGSSEGALAASTVPMRSTETFEWVPGGYFLLHRWDGLVGDHPDQGMEILGYDAERQEYISHFFDNDGNHPTYRVTEQDGVWTYTGERQRARHDVDPTGATIMIHWDWSRDGEDWQPLCDLTSVKVGELPASERTRRSHAPTGPKAPPTPSLDT